MAQRLPGLEVDGSLMWTNRAGDPASMPRSPRHQMYAMEVLP
jgi:hypothetical protein